MEPLCSVKLGITADNADYGSDAELEQDKDPEELEQEAGVASTVSVSEELEQEAGVASTVSLSSIISLLSSFSSKYPSKSLSLSSSNN